MGRAPENKLYLRNGNFYWGGSNGKVLALGVLVICPTDKNPDFKTKKMTYGPKFQFCWVKIAHFRPEQPVGVSLANVFNTKEVSYRFPVPNIMVPKVLFPSLKIKIFGPKTAKFCQK